MVSYIPVSGVAYQEHFSLSFPLPIAIIKCCYANIIYGMAIAVFFHAGLTKIKQGGYRWILLSITAVITR
jgi:hypothetical protein